MALARRQPKLSADDRPGVVRYYVRDGNLPEASCGPSFDPPKNYQPSFFYNDLLSGKLVANSTPEVFRLAMAATTLRAVTHRLTTTPVDQLPSIASFLATSLSDCAELLSAPQTQKPGKSDSENAVQVHKLKTRLASLLQDRSVEGRWTAVLLVKATVEAGQWEILRGYEPIVRSLIAILAVWLSGIIVFCSPD